MRSGCLSVVPQRDGVQVLFDVTLCAGREFECSLGASLRRPRGATASPTGEAAAHVQVVRRTFACFPRGRHRIRRSSVALKRAFWDLEEVLASVGIAKSSGGFVCTDLPCCPECKRNEDNSWD